MCQFHTDNWVVDESLAECLTLVGVFDGFFIADTSETNCLDNNTNTLVVEVGNNDYIKGSVTMIRM